MPTFARVRRERGPALAWTPTQDSYHELAQRLRGEGRLPVYVTQPAILEFEAHLRDSALPMPFGLLAGDVCVCPRTKLEYLLVDTVSHAHVELGGADPYAQISEELQSLASERSREHKVAIGWYLGGLADDLTLDEDVTRMHEQLFPERWQLVLVRGAVAGAEHGAFLRYESIWTRWFSIPFFEVLSERAAKNKGEHRTAIRWENYLADQPARPLGEPEVSVSDVNLAPRPSWGARLFGASVEPHRRVEHGAHDGVADRARAASAPARKEPPSVPRSQTATPPVALTPTVTVPASLTNSLERTPSAIRATQPSPAQPTEREVTVPIVVDAGAPIVRELTTVEPSVTTPAEQVRAAPVQEAVSEAHRIFIDGMLVTAPLAAEPSPKPGTSPGTDRPRTSPVSVGVLLLLTLVLLYLIVR